MDKQTKEGQGLVCTCCGHYGSGSGCGCGCGGYGHGWMGHSVLRIVLALAIAFFVFWFGVKVGEIKSQLYGGFGGGREGGYYMMRGYGNYNGYGGGMMVPGVAIPAVPSAPATPTK